MAFLIGVLLAIISLIVLALPFVRGSRRGTVISPWNGQDDPRREREAIYDEIRTLRLEYELGGIGEEEYRSRLRSYRLSAASVLREEERLDEQVRSLDQELEEEILASRQREEALNGAVLCSECGQPLARSARRCPNCGGAATQEDPPASEWG